MNSDRHVLRQTQNHGPHTYTSLPKPSSYDLPNKNQLTISNNNNLHEQENLLSSLIPNKISITSRPILTAIRTKNKNEINKNDNESDIDMLISPAIKENLIHENNLSRFHESTRTREELEQDLYELPDYRQSIFQHLKSVENLYAPKMNFMEHQSDINSTMRTILIDWLIEVTDEYRLTDETFFLCVQYVDRFLSAVNVTRPKLQLLGTTCMYIASKYEEMYPPALEEFSFITDNTYETQHILRMEQIVIKNRPVSSFVRLHDNSRQTSPIAVKLFMQMIGQEFVELSKQMLNFSLSGPTPYTFLQYYLTHLKRSILNNNNDEYNSLKMLSNYFCFLSVLHDQPFSSHSASKLSATCLLYALQLLNQNLKIDSLWSKFYIELTTYTYSDLNQCRLALEEIHNKTYYQDKTTSSLLRRYLNIKKGNDPYQKCVREIIHHSKFNGNVNDDDILDLTLDDFDEGNMSMDHHR